MAVGLWVAVIALGLALLYNLRTRRPKLNLPPGPPGIPVLGNITVLRGRQLPHQAFADLSKQCGPFMFLRLGSTPCIVVSSPEVCKEVFKEQDRVFASRRISTGTRLLMYNATSLGTSPYGEVWRQMRRTATVELLTQRRVNQFESLRVAEVSEMVRAIAHHNTLNESGKPLNVRIMFKALSFNFATQICFTKKFYEYNLQDPGHGATAGDEQKEINTEEAKYFIEMMDEIVALAMANVIGDFIPYLSFLELFSDIKPRMMKAHKGCDAFLSRILQEHKTNPKQANPDFMDVLLGLTGIDGSQHLDDVGIKALCWSVLVGGTETTSTVLEWSIAEVLKHPDIAAKLKAELDTVVGKERLVIEEDIPNLPYLQAVVKETLRFHPPLQLGVPHESIQQTQVMGYDIPKSTMLITNIWAMHRDPDVWDHPMQFRPERFLERPDIDVRGQHYQLLPFGTGRRGCPAVSLGLIMVQYPLARLVQAFDWSLPNGMKPEDLDMEESRFKGTTLPRAHALDAVVTPRLSSLLY